MTDSSLLKSNSHSASDFLLIMTEHAWFLEYLWSSVLSHRIKRWKLLGLWTSFHTRFIRMRFKGNVKLYIKINSIQLHIVSIKYKKYFYSLFLFLSFILNRRQAPWKTFFFALGVFKTFNNKLCSL